MLSETDTQFSHLTGARQTMSAWVRVLETIDAIPTAYRDYCLPFLADQPVFPYMVLAPVITGLRRKSTEKLLFEVNRIFHIIERENDAIKTAQFPLDAITCLEEGNALIYSWFTLQGTNPEGIPLVSTVEFNTATYRLIAPFIAKIRPAPVQVSEQDWEDELSDFDYLSSPALKFRNFARESLIPGEKVLQTVWQPQIRQPVARLLNRLFYRSATLSHLTILTDCELIHIRDNERVTANRGVRYGGVWRYVPRRHIASAALTEQENDLTALKLELSSGHTLEILFEKSNLPALSGLKEEL